MWKMDLVADLGSQSEAAAGDAAAAAGDKRKCLTEEVLQKELLKEDIFYKLFP